MNFFSYFFWLAIYPWFTFCWLVGWLSHCGVHGRTGRVRVRGAALRILNAKKTEICPRAPYSANLDSSRYCATTQLPHQKKAREQNKPHISISPTGPLSPPPLPILLDSLPRKRHRPPATKTPTFPYPTLSLSPTHALNPPTPHLYINLPKPVPWGRATFGRMR